MVNEVLSIVKMLTGWLGYARNARAHERQQLLDALVAVYRAANLTRSYLADASISEEGERMPSGEYPVDVRQKISDSWLDVASKLIRLNHGQRDQLASAVDDLAHRCFQKSQYWSDPKGWKVSGVDIELGKLVQEAIDAIDEMRGQDRSLQVRLV